MFESFANSKRYKTQHRISRTNRSLRALLIQKDTKQLEYASDPTMGLRALLIQKDTKHFYCNHATSCCLRALLIQKDTKPVQEELNTDLV